MPEFCDRLSPKVSDAALCVHVRTSPMTRSDLLLLAMRVTKAVAPRLSDF